MINSKIPFVASIGLLSALITEIILPSGTVTVQFNKRFLSITTGLVIAYSIAKSIK